MLTEASPSEQTPISDKSDTLPSWLKTEPPTMPELRRMFDLSRQEGSRARMNSLKFRDYYDGPGQLSPGVRFKLRQRGQPEIWTNRIRPAINGLIGVIQGARSDPRGYPRNPDDEEASDVCTKILRYVSDISRWSRIKLDCANNYLIEGTMAAIVPFDGENPSPTQIRWEEFFADPYSRRNDFKDAKYMGIAQWHDADDVKAEHPEAYGSMGDPITGGLGALDQTWEDRPNNTLPWVDIGRRRMLVIELYYNRGGKWHRCLYCAAGVLEHDESPYKDKKGYTANPIEAQSCYVDRENQRYGPIQDMIPIQDEVNSRRSRLLHLANTRQVQNVDPSAPPVDSATVRKEAAQADGVIPQGWQAVPTADIAEGQAILLQEAKAEIERMGPTPAVLGRQGGEAQSGRARLVLQQAGLTEQAGMLDGIDDWENRIYGQMWDRVRQFWTDPMYIRVTDEVRAPEFLQINEPQMGMVMQRVQVGVNEAGQPLMAMRPQVGVTGYSRRPAEMDMDIIVESVPHSANLQQEEFATVMELINNGLDPLDPRFELIIEMSGLTDKARIIERIKAAKQDMSEKSPEQQQAEAQQQQLVQANAEAEVQGKQAAAAKDMATVEKTKVETALLPIKQAHEDVAKV